jgi:hypothetical protein
MKKQLLICCIIFLSLNSNAQLDTIPNASFEDWYYTANWNIAAVGWHNNNSSIAAWNVMPDSISNTGILSLRLEKVSYRGIIWSGFPISQHPLSLDGTMKNGLGIGDTALISVHVYSSGFMVDSGYAEIYGGIGSTFLPFTINITQNASAADSCVITLTGGNIFGSVIWFDDLSFSFATSVDENFSDSDWTVYPNPCAEQLYIISANGIKENSIITLQDLSGRIIHVERILQLNNRFAINTESLSTGMYILTVSDGKSNHHIHIVKD